MNTTKPVPCLVTMCAAFAMLAVSTARAQPAVCSAPPTFVDFPAPVDQGYFASDIALDGDGDMALVGEIFGDGLDPDPEDAIDESGTVRIFSRPDGPWEEVQAIQHEGALPFDHFGSSVDISGSLAIVAAPGRENTNGSIGAAYIFERNLNLPITEQWWEQAVIFNPAGPLIDNGFGGSLTRHETVAIDGRFAVVGAAGANGNAGVANVFYNSGGTWTHEFQLEPPDPQPGDPGAQFGYCVDISGTRVIVGAPYRNAEGFQTGRAYVFKRNVPSTPKWVLEDVLVPTNQPFDFDHFGWSVSIDATNAVVGAPEPLGEYPDQTISPAGVGYAVVFRRLTGSDWVQDGTSGRLVPSNVPVPQVGQAFGYAVNISGSLALIGANGYDYLGINDVGTAYTFQRLTSWTQGNQYFSSASPALGDRVGETLALDGGEIVVGVLSDEPSNSPPGFQNAGSVLFGWACSY